MSSSAESNSNLSQLCSWLVSDKGNAALKLIGGMGVLCFAVLESLGPRNDLDIYLEAAKGMWNGRDIYSDTYFDGYHYYYSPLFAAVIYPLSILGSGVAKSFWILVNVCLLVRMYAVIEQYLIFPDKAVQRWFALLMVLVSLRFVKDNLHFGQVTILILYLCIEGLHALRRGKNGGAWLIALGINIKILPVVFLPYLLLRREFKALGWVLAGLLCFHFLPMFFLSAPYFRDIQHSYFMLINPFRSAHLLDIEEASFHSLTTWVTVFFSPAMEQQGLTLRRHFMELSAEGVAAVIQVLRALLMLLTLWVLRKRFFQRMSDTQEIWSEWSWLLALIPLVFPHQQHYAFLFALPMLLWLMYLWLSWRLSRWMKVAVVLISVVFNLSLWMGMGNGIYNHYKGVTWAALWMLCVFLLQRKTPDNSAC
jgi:hypothetical protein